MPRDVRTTFPGRYYRDRFGFLYLRHESPGGFLGIGWERLTGFVGPPWFPVDPVEVPTQEAKRELEGWGRA